MSSYFNSIKVRLEHSGEAQSVMSADNFNSIKVRLELTGLQPDSTRRLFQFHKGTIRTYPEYRSRVNQCYFNSIKVRLEHLREQISQLTSCISIP